MGKFGRRKNPTGLTGKASQVKKPNNRRSQASYIGRSQASYARRSQAKASSSLKNLIKSIDPWVIGLLNDSDHFHLSRGQILLERYSTEDLEKVVSLFNSEKYRQYVQNDFSISLRVTGIKIEVEKRKKAEILILSPGAFGWVCSDDGEQWIAKGTLDEVISFSLNKTRTLCSSIEEGEIVRFVQRLALICSQRGYAFAQSPYPTSGPFFVEWAPQADYSHLWGNPLTSDGAWLRS